MRGVLAVGVAVGVATAPAVFAVGCSAGSETSGDAGHSPSDAAVDFGHTDGAFHPDASCLVEIENWPLLPACHVDLDAALECPPDGPVGWNSNPPSSGPHYSVWAAYQTYTTAVPRRYYLHDEEHGAIVFVYNCVLLGDAGVALDGGGAGDAADPCSRVAAGLQTASDSIPTDPLCTTANQGVRVRYVLTPDPLVDVPVAAAAWGWTYKAQCLDLPTLEAFANAHYAMGPEDFCSNGTTQF